MLIPDPLPDWMDQEMLPGKGKELEHLQQGPMQEHKPLGAQS